MKYRKCCDTPRGGNFPHLHGCVNADGGTQHPLRGMSKADRIDMMHAVGGDLPDGAFLALAGELGVGVDDLCDSGKAVTSCK